ncbi:hypothetical protein B0H11DRAFT_719391 [Mycena galericulata]|nr:hypothetical protein B0H11DRAFT_719391 [Mycena galericulata]
MPLLYAILLAAIPSIYAQTAPLMFDWGFTGSQSASNLLPSCQDLPMTVDAITAHGVPPFYMMAFAVVGIPSTTFIGTKESNLSWTVTHPIGTQLLLGVVDSQGNSGGIDAPLYTVTEGTTTQCIPQTANQTSFTITANVTDVLNTCQPWGLTIEGGTPPYHITLAAKNFPVIANFTLSLNDSAYTYINRAPPGTQMLAAASDANGLWAMGSPFVNTQGSSDVDCAGLLSGATPPAHDAPRTIPSISNAGIGAIAGGSATALFAVCGVIILVIVRRRRMKQSQTSVSEIAPFCEVSPIQDTHKSSHLVPSPSSSFPGGTFVLGDEHTTRSPSGMAIVTLPVATDSPPPY